MRYIELFIETEPTNTVVDNLQKQAKLKADQAKKLRAQSQVIKNRNGLNAAIKKQNQLSAAASKPN